MQSKESGATSAKPETDLGVLFSDLALRISTGGGQWWWVSFNIVQMRCHINFQLIFMIFIFSFSWNFEKKMEEAFTLLSV